MTVDDIIFPNRPEAENVLDKMFAQLSQYESVSVADFFDMVGETPAFTDEKWGWTDLRGSSVSRVGGGGYLLNLPKPEPLD